MDSIDFQLASEQSTAKSLLELVEQSEHAAQQLNQANQRFVGSDVRFWNTCNRPIYILDLNDHCLQKILRFLDSPDLASVAMVDGRLRKNAISIFPLKFKSFAFGNTAESQDLMEDLDKLECFLENFGAFIVELHLSFFYVRFSVNRFVELFARHCSDALRGLHLDRFHLEGSLLSTIQPLFGGLTWLDTDGCVFTDSFIETLVLCRELKRLDIRSSNGDCRLLQFNIPKLETIVFVGCGGLEPQQLEKFLECNPQLKEVLIRESSETGRNILSVIGKHLPSVEKIWIDCMFRSHTSFDRCAFRSLKKLRIESKYRDSSALSLAITELAAAKVPLQFLHLKFHRLDANQLVDAISDIKIQTLNLVIHSDLDISQWSRICQNLTELTDLVINSQHGLHRNTLTEIIQNARNLQRIKLDIQSKNIFEYMCLPDLWEILEKRSLKMPLEIYTRREVAQPQNDLNSRPELLTFVKFSETYGSHNFFCVADYFDLFECV